MDKVISFLFGCIVLIWILGFVVGQNLFEIISEHGLKSVVTCVWDGNDACSNLGSESTNVVEQETEDRNSHIQ